VTIAAQAEQGAAATPHPAPERAQVTLAALWFGLFGAPAAWTVQTLVDLAVAAHGCFPRLEPLAAPTTGVRWLTGLVSVLAIAACTAAAVVAWRSWSRTRHEHQGASDTGRTQARGSAALETGEGRTRFMALAGLMTSVTFLLVTLVHGLTVLLVRPCGA
jgi:hypothetical protein